MVLVHYIPDHLIRVSAVRDGVKRLLRPNSVDELPRPGKHCGQEVIGVSMKLERRVGLESQLKLNNAEWLPRPFHTASKKRHFVDLLLFFFLGGESDGISRTNSRHFTQDHS